MWIDPVTGAIMKQQETQVRTLPDGGNALNMALAFTDETVAANVDSAKKNGSKLALVGRLPWIAGAIGLVAIGLGLILARINGREEEQAQPVMASESGHIGSSRFGEQPALGGATAVAPAAAGAGEATAPRRVTLEKE